MIAVKREPLSLHNKTEISDDSLVSIPRKREKIYLENCVNVPLLHEMFTKKLQILNEVRII